METLYFEISDTSVKVGVTVTETSTGALQFEVVVLEDTGIIGDLNGLFFDLADDSIAENLSLSGEDMTGEKIDANSVTKIASFTNMNGEIIKEDGKYDVGIQFGTSGIANDDIQSTTFYLSTTDGTVLTIADIFGQDFGVRLTSVGEIDGAREDSVKISGSADPVDPPVEPEEPPVEPEEPPVEPEEPPVDPEEPPFEPEEPVIDPEEPPFEPEEPVIDPEEPPFEPEEPVIDQEEPPFEPEEPPVTPEEPSTDPTGPSIAENDRLVVFSSEPFSDTDETDMLDNFQFTVLANDKTGEGDYTGQVVSVNGQDVGDGITVEGSHGGLLTINADGTVDFSANGAFDFLSGDDFEITSFEYTIEGGDTATLDVFVNSDDIL